MKYSKYIIALFLMVGALVYAQPLKAPKMFPKFAAMKTGAQAESDFRAQKLDQPKMKEKGQVNKQDTTLDMQSDEPSESKEINWITFEQAIEKQKIEPRKLFLDVYTDWCGWCKKMDSSTFVDPNVVKVLNEKYYAIKFDAEQKGDIVFKGKTYKYVNQGRGYHELAQFFLNNRMSYPTSVFLDEKLEVIQPIPGFLDADKMDMILQYFGTDSYLTVPWDTYQKQYKKAK